uniref:Uncharacterized protein n=1 Tax=Anopheles melas TaxID=34690 RepID=A0A182TES9_9DIPT
MSTELGGIFSPAPRSPYPSSGGMTSLRFSPSHMPSSPWSQPLITWPMPSVKVSGLPRGMLLSNSVPSSSVPWKEIRGANEETVVSCGPFEPYSSLNPFMGTRDVPVTN